MTDLVDPSVAADVANRALEQVLATHRAARAAADGLLSAIVVVASTVTADRTAVTAMLAAFGVEHQFRTNDDGTVELRVKRPDGQWGVWSPNIRGPEGDVGPAPTFAVQSAAEGEEASAVLSADPSTANHWLLNLVLPRGDKGDKGDTGGPLPDQAAATFVGRAAGAGTGAPGLLSAAQAKSILALAIADTDGLQAALNGKASQAAVDEKAPLESPALTGNPTAPTQTAGNSSTCLATTAFVAAEIAAAVQNAEFVFATAAELLADTSLSYSAGLGFKLVNAGDRFQGARYWYRVAASGASDAHCQTSGGVKLYVEPEADGNFAAAAFGATLDGVADDTVAAIAGFRAAKAAGASLLIDGELRIVAASVPAGAKTAHSGLDYIQVSNIKGGKAARIIVDGLIFFDTSGLAVTKMSDFSVRTIGHELNENSAANSSQPVFRSFGGAKSLIRYERVSVVHDVTDLTGAYRGGWVVWEEGAARVEICQLSGENCIGVVSLVGCSDIAIRDPIGKNVQTTVWLSAPAGYHATGIRHRNTKQQADYWVGRTAAVPRNINGQDGILVDQGQDGWVDDIEVVWAHERGCYLQGSRQRVTRGRAINCDGWKIVGNSYADRGIEARLKDCHVLLDANWASTRGRISASIGAHYWIDDVIAEDCSITNESGTTNAVAAMFTTAQQRDGSTVNGLTIRRCTGKVVSRMVMAALTTKTDAELAALSPIGSTISLKNLMVEDCWIEKAPSRFMGSLLDIYTVTASSDALTHYAVEDVQFRRNTIILPATAAQRDDWLFDPRYVNGVVSEDNRPNRPFVNSFFSASVTAPYQNIVMREPNLLYEIDGGTLWTRLANLSLKAGSSLRFRGIITTKPNEVLAEAVVDGAPTVKRQTVRGLGYHQIATTAVVLVEMRADGQYYAGKRVGATITDQVGTKPVATTGTDANIIQIRGDISPTVLYEVVLTSV